VVVEACAGSGKTWMLVSRIVRLLLAGVEPHHILAITFTRAAAGDARPPRRLARRMAMRASRGAHPRTADSRHRPGDAVRLEPALRALHGRLLDSGRPVAVLTFHAWFVQLLRLAPLEMLESLGLQPDMSLIEDDVDLRAPVFRAFHAAVLRDPALRADYGAMVATRGRHMLDQWLGRTWQRRMEIAQADAAGTLEGSVEPASEWWAELEGIADPAQQVDDAVWRERLLALAATWQRHRNKTPRDAAAEIAAAYALPTPHSRFEAIDSALLTQTGTVRKNLPESPALAEAGVHVAAARAGGPARRSRRAPAHGPALASAARRACRPQAPPWLCRHGRSRTAGAGRAARRRPRRLDAGEARPARAPPADRRVPGHVDQPARTGQGPDRRLGAGGRPHAFRGRRSDAVDLPFPRRRAARVRGGGRFRGRCVRRPSPRLRPPGAARRA
jgi:hypothetical protein